MSDNAQKIVAKLTEEDEFFAADFLNEPEDNTHPGHDYSGGMANVDKETGIHYGVISVHEISQAWADSSEADYGKPTCPDCGEECRKSNPDNENEDDEYYCDRCEHSIGNDEVWGDDPFGFYLDDGEYKMQQSADDSDVWVLKSPYYTFCQYCSPCAPGAGHLQHPARNGVKTYCLGHDWFSDTPERKAPYKVFSVESGQRVLPEERPQ